MTSYVCDNCLVELQDNELHLLRGVWSLIRGGKLADAASLCAASGQMWRAASLMGYEHQSDRKAENCEEDRMFDN